jgi:hypothetical protein
MRTFSLVLLAALSLGGFVACEQQCEFRERCDGNTREVCGAAEEVPRIERYPCEAPSPACVAIDDDTALCVTDPPTTCDKDTFMPVCEGDLLRVCRGAEYLESPSYPTHYVVATDCVADNESCSIADGVAACR